MKMNFKYNLIICAIAILGMSCGSTKEKALEVEQATDTQAEAPEAPDEKVYKVQPKEVEPVPVTPAEPIETPETTQELPSEKIDDKMDLELMDAPQQQAKLNHDSWDKLLKKHVDNDGMVDYKGFKADEAELDAYLTLLKATSPENWPRNEQMAFWSNAYNAFTVKLLLDHYPLKSITDLKFSGKSAWDHPWIEMKSGTLTLNDIENKILRPKFKDPRIHFIINCASFSCPILVNAALTGENIETIMTAQAKSFVNDKARNKISANQAEISKIFKWYAEDFGDIITFLNKYSVTKIKAGVKPTYLAYDWSLNKQ